MDSFLYEDEFPFAWQRMASLSVAEIELMESANVDILRACLAMDSTAADFTTQSSGEEAGALEMIDQKLRVILDLLGHLMRRELELPPTHRLSLGTREIAWTEAHNAARQGEEIMLEFYPYSVLPRPLSIPARVSMVHPAKEGGTRVVARFNEPGESVAELLEKWIFRKHRRQVAQRRPVKR